MEKETKKIEKTTATSPAKAKASTTKKKPSEEKKTATKKAAPPAKTSDKSTTAKKKKTSSNKVKKTSFCKNAKYCGDFLIDDFVVYQDKVKDAFVLKGGGFGQAVFNGRAYELFVSKAYIDAKGYRRWLQAAFPKSSITEERAEEISMGGIVSSGYKGSPLLTEKGDCRYATVKVTVDFGDNTAPSSAVGYALITRGNPNSLDISSSDPYNFISFARASALARILEAKGFGEGLDWESLKISLQPFICIQSNCEEYRFIKYNGPVTDSSTKKLVSKGTVTADEFFKSVVLGENDRLFSLDDMNIEREENTEQIDPSDASETETVSDIQRLINAHNQAVSQS